MYPNKKELYSLSIETILMLALDILRGYGVYKNKAT